MEPKPPTSSLMSNANIAIQITTMINVTITTGPEPPELSSSSSSWSSSSLARRFASFFWAFCSAFSLFFSSFSRFLSSSPSMPSFSAPASISCVFSFFAIFIPAPTRLSLFGSFMFQPLLPFFSAHKYNWSVHQSPGSLTPFLLS